MYKCITPTSETHDLGNIVLQLHFIVEERMSIKEVN